MAMQQQASKSLVGEDVAASNDATVLAQYLKMLHGVNVSGTDNLLSNSVVDWFGRSVRGAHNICDFFKLEVANKFELSVNLQKLQACEAIEHRPVHMCTKSVVARGLDYINPRNKVNIASTSLKPYADSDLDDDDNDDVDMMPLSVSPPSGNKTPERAEGEMAIETLTPPKSKSKPWGDASDSESDDNNGNNSDFMEVRAKRIKRSYPSSASATPTATTSITCAPISNKKSLWGLGARGETGGSSNEDTDSATANTKFTPLRYFEVFGVLRKRNEANSVDGEANDNNTVRIRISYRTRIADQQILFALIIYDNAEDLKVKQQSLRRNLLTEFSQKATATNELTSDEDDVVDDGVPVSERLIETQPAEVAVTAAATMTDTHLPALDIMSSSAASNNAIDSLRTPSKMSQQTPPPTPKRRQRFAAMSGMKRLQVAPSPSMPKRPAARSLRL